MAKEFDALNAVMDSHSSFADEVKLRTNNNNLSWVSTSFQKIKFWKKDKGSIEVNITDRDRASDKAVKFLR